MENTQIERQNQVSVFVLYNVIVCFNALQHLNKNRLNGFYKVLKNVWRNEERASNMLNKIGL